MSSPPTPSVVRWPISVKIFGLSVGLLALMIVVALLTSINFRRVGEQLALLSDHYIELDQLMSDVRVEGVREVVQIERVLHARPRVSPSGAAEAEALHKDAGDCSPEALRPVQEKIRKAYPERAERRLVSYRVRRLCTDQRLGSALRMVDATLALPQVRAAPGDIERLTAIKSEIGNIAGARQKLHAGFERYLVQLRAGDEPGIAAAQEYIDEHRAEVNRRISAVTAALHKGTRESAERTEELERKTRWLSWTVTMVACMLGLLVAGLITRNLVRPVRELLGLTTSIRTGNLDVQVPIRSTDEIGQLAASFNHMVGELKQKEVITQMFGKYVDPRVVQRLLLAQTPFADGGERQTMSVFFSDLEAFTVLCEGMTPTAVVRLLNRYFSLMAESIRAEQGVIDKYMGDSIMAFWGPPFCAPGQQATLACRAALAQQARLSVFRSLLPEVLGLRKNLPAVNVRMGIATGDVTVGSIGSEDARSFTVIGDTANLASRLEGANKRYGTQILIDEETRRLAGESVEVREIDAIRVVGKTEPTRMYELLGHTGGLAPAAAELRARYEEGLTLFRTRKLDEARAAFAACLTIDGADGPSRLFIERLRAIEGRALPEPWDGVFTMPEK